MLFSSKLRKSLAPIFKLLFLSRITWLLLILIVYVAATVLLLDKIHLWNRSILKDTIIWTIAEAAVLAFNINKAKDISFFKGTIVHTFKWVVLTDFLFNFYTFSLPIELILMPGILFLVLLQVVANKDEKAKQVARLIGGLMNFLIGGIIIFVVYETISEYKSLLTLNSFLSLIHPIMMTLLFLPFAYGMALYFGYDALFTFISIYSKDRRHQIKTKLHVVSSANFSLKRLFEIRKNLNFETVKDWSF